MSIERMQKGVAYLLGLGAVMVLLAPGYVTEAATHDDAEPTALHDLASVDELKAIFNEGKGSPRLLMLLSPT